MDSFHFDFFGCAPRKQNRLRGRGLEARAQIMATRESLQAALELQEADIPEISQATARLERVEAELDRIEAGIAMREGLA